MGVVVVPGLCRAAFVAVVLACLLTLGIPATLGILAGVVVCLAAFSLIVAEMGRGAGVVAGRGDE